MSRLQDIEVTLCSCEPASCTLLRYGLWASTVTDPQTAFSTSLLEWVVMLTLESQVSVEAFCRVVRYKNQLSYTEDCSNFKAGNSLRSQAKQKKLDIQGVFGSVCRHEVPRRFLNMTHGERLGYPVYMIQKLLSDVEGSKDVKLKIVHDISCILVAHLKKKQGGPQMLAQIDIALDVFHAYGHKTACQLKYSTRRRPGYGLTDGESVERMWAFLRKFSRTTKEMTPSRRIDLLTDAIFHYTMRKTLDIDVALVTKLQNAKKASSVAEEGLKAVMNEANATFAKWKKEYAQKLHQLKTLRQKIQESQDEDDAAVYRASYVKLDDEVAGLERKHKIKQRWTPSSPDFVAVMKEVDMTVRTTLLSKMRVLAYERSFLMSLKKKYPDGQAIAIKLTKQLKTTNTKLQKTITSYNEVKWEPMTSDFPAAVEFREATDPSWQHYSCLEPTVSEPGVPRSLQRKAIEHLNLLHRAREEKEMVEQEMKEVFYHFQNERDLAELAVTQFDENEAGKRAALTTHISSYLTMFPFRNPEKRETCEDEDELLCASDEERVSDCEIAGPSRVSPMLKETGTGGPEVVEETTIPEEVELISSQEKETERQRERKKGRGKAKGKGKRKREEEGPYFVEKLVGKRMQGGEVQYHVKWQGWPDSANTWEPTSNIHPDTIEIFYPSN
ncbi:hypothetical protein Bbelb_395810 [Branchiostoma belcheri]|nr:hypothetical protein Bbelb_395810 [Branchiostoma belcheri]